MLTIKKVDLLELDNNNAFNSLISLFLSDKNIDSNIDKGRFPLYSSLSKEDIDISINEENNNDNRDISIIAYYEEIEYNKKIKDKEERPYSRGDRLLDRRSGSASLIKDKLSKSNSSFSLEGPRR